MLALVYDGTVKLRRDHAEARPPAGEALLKIRKAGICRTDLEISRGYMNFRGVMGHEFVADVLEGPSSLVGKRVVGEINCVCGVCEMCKSGLANHCRRRTVLGIQGRDGVFAEYACLPARNLHEVPQGLSDAEAVFVEPLAAAFQLIHQVKLDPSQPVLILGDGRLGQLIARALRTRVKRPILVGRHAAKLEAAEKQGIQTFHADDFRPRGDYALVVDATGSSQGFAAAMEAVRPRGTIVLKSTTALSSDVNLAPLVVNEVTVIGSRCGPFPEAIRALARREVDVSALISKEYPLSRAVEALKAAQDGRNLKVLLDVSR